MGGVLKELQPLQLYIMRSCGVVLPSTGGWAVMMFTDISWLTKNKSKNQKKDLKKDPPTIWLQFSVTSQGIHQWMRFCWAVAMEINYKKAVWFHASTQLNCVSVITILLMTCDHIWKQLWCFSPVWLTLSGINENVTEMSTIKFIRPQGRYLIITIWFKILWFDFQTAGPVRLREGRGSK